MPARWLVPAIVFCCACTELGERRRGGDAGQAAVTDGGTIAADGGPTLKVSVDTGVNGESNDVGDTGIDGSDAANVATPTLDRDPPRVLRSSPTDGDRGVESAEPITITFSEPMDRLRTQAAVRTSFAVGGEALAWNDASTVLTIRPAGGLELPSGTDLAAPRKTYDVSVSEDATDLAGNRLTPWTMRFSTLRRISSEIRASGTLSRTVRVWWSRCSVQPPDADCVTETALGSDDAALEVGELDVYQNHFSKFAGIVFDISGVPPSVRRIESATMRVTQDEVIGEPYARLGALTAESVALAKVADKAEKANLSFVLSFTPALGTREVDVTPAVEYDRTHPDERNGSSAFRIRFEQFLPTSSDNHRVAVGWAEDKRPRLSVVFLVP